MIDVGHVSPAAGKSRIRRNERGFLQRRFIEHWIRDELDLKRHVDYIHFNPVKHGHVQAAGDWPFSTFQRYVKVGEYEPDWGGAEPESLQGWSAGEE
jgi:putative transposase